jgi:nucleoside-diphosphate-sugar epimerase
LQGKVFKTSSGNQVRDFLYVSDFTNLIKKIITKKKIKSGIYNVGSGQQTSLKTIIKKIGVLIKNGKIKYNAISMRKEEVKFLYPSIKKIKKSFNWRPQTNIFSGLKKTIRFYEK